MSYTLQWGVAFDYLPYFLGGALVTLHLTFLGFLAGLIIGITTAVAQVYGSPLMQRTANIYVVFFTNTPSLVTAFFIFFGLPEFGILLSPYLCILINLALNAGAFLADVFRSGIQSVKTTEMEAAEIMGFSLFQKVQYVIAPHIAKTLYPPISNLYIIFILGSALASIFGVEELTGRAFNVDSETFRSIEIYTIAATIYVLMTFAASFALALVGRYVFRVKARMF
ncbi:MAG TPA: amino acid ABC transporter permease [Rhodospirillales bacterium]|jgi:polar amino acid transport system permease protein|nr:amino acid ABC transporter permease [Rhodospirillales bacterium]HIL75024.1 amino acid ABC transporter permease [Rhodospirillales bacterium]